MTEEVEPAKPSLRERFTKSWPTLCQIYYGHIESTFTLYSDLRNYKKMDWRVPAKIGTTQRFFVLLNLMNLINFSKSVYSGDTGLVTVMMLVTIATNLFVIRSTTMGYFVGHPSGTGWPAYCGTYIRISLFEFTTTNTVNNSHFIDSMKWLKDNLEFDDYEIYDPNDNIKMLDGYTTGAFSLSEIDFGGRIAFVFKNKDDAMLFKLTNGGTFLPGPVIV